MDFIKELLERLIESRIAIDNQECWRYIACILILKRRRITVTSDSDE